MELVTQTASEARRKLGLDDGLLIALLPGSRRGEIRRLAGVFINAARLIHKRNPTAKFILPFANRAAADEYHATVGAVSDLPLTTRHGDSRLVLAACNAAILASGTAALEAALLQCPHLVAYKLPPFSYWLMRRLRHIDYYSMPNQLLPEPLVPELIQGDATAENIARETESLLSDNCARPKLNQTFREVA